MLTPVHGEPTAVDQWTGLTFSGSKRFKIPDIASKWRGCYGSPTTALAGLAAYIGEKREQISKDLEHELMDIFQASLRRDLEAVPDQPSDPKIIEKAPDYHLLETYGGNLTVSAYLLMCHYDFFRKAWTQVTKTADSEESASATDAVKKDEPNVWYETTVPTGKAAATFTRVKMPRCCKAFLSFVRSMAAQSTDDQPPYPLAATIYFNPRNVNHFAVGRPLDFNRFPNSRVSDVFQGAPVYGSVRVYSRTAIKLGSDKRKRKEQRAKGTGPAIQDEKKSAAPKTVPAPKRQKKVEAAAAPVPDSQSSQEEELSGSSSMESDE